MTPLVETRELAGLETSLVQHVLLPIDSNMQWDSFSDICCYHDLMWYILWFCIPNMVNVKSSLVTCTCHDAHLNHSG